MATLFRTPTKIPLDAFTQFAVHAKPNSNNPIGHFGTGLKYAVAIILRHGGQFKMWVDGVEYEFYTHKTKFRDTDIETIRFRKKNGLGKWLKSYKLPFTTELGKNWGLWQAYRELLSNTFDEGGSITVTDIPVLVDKGVGTVIQVDLPGFDDAGKDLWLNHELRDEGRDPDAPDFADNHVKVWKRPSKYIYCKGVRVHELPIPSFFTYNFTGMVVLSEDRSLMNQYSIMEYIANWLDRQNLEDIRVLFTDKDNRWFEAHELSYYHLASKPAGSVRAAARLTPSPGYYLSSLLTSPKKKDTWNIDVDMTLKDAIEFVQCATGTVVQDTNLCSEIFEWVLNHADLLQEVRDDAANNGWKLPLLLQS